MSFERVGVVLPPPAIRCEPSVKQAQRPGADAINVALSLPTKLDLKNNQPAICRASNASKIMPNGTEGERC
jgi:hypothetical protein